MIERFNMRQLLPFIILISWSLPHIQGQQVHGVILDRETGAAVPFADIYVEGTFKGTMSDSTGSFRLNMADFPNRSIIISALGYYSHTFPWKPGDQKKVIHLIPRRYELQEVTIGTRSLEQERSKNMRLFRREFMGTSPMARRCEILNESVITFNYGSDQDTLIGIALEPIRILNRGLGYEITYYLDRFTYDRNFGTTTFIGSIFFRKERNRYERHRRNAFKGSFLHFFRALWKNELDQTPFKVRDSTGQEVDYSQMVATDEQGHKFLHHNGYLDLYYFANWSRLDFIRDSVPFDESGYFDPQAISWQGRLGKLRVGDWLPSDYVPD
jgi:hypothetical protein